MDNDDIAPACDPVLADVIREAAEMVEEGYDTEEILSVLRTLPDGHREEIGLG
jgi:hypothetical protein